MIKEELRNYFSEKLKQGFTVTQLQDEALSKGYSQNDINDTFSEIINSKSSNSNDSSSNLKILVLSILIILVLSAIIIIIVINLDKREPEKIIELNKTEVITEKYFEKINLSTQMFNNSNLYSSDNFSLYLKNHPQEVANSIKLTENLGNCNNTDAQFSGDSSNSHYNGQLYIEEMGDNCLVGYRSNLSMDCNFTKEQIKNIVEGSNKKLQSENMSYLTGPFYYFGCIFEIDFRVLGDTFKEMAKDVNKKIDETLNKSRINYTSKTSYGESLMTDTIIRNFTNNITGEIYPINCTIY